MTLTHNVTLDWADAALDTAKHRGLTPFGREVVREMNRLGMLVDLSHVSPGTMSAALDVTEAPVIFSHSASRALVDHRRNVPDSILARLPKNGGVVMVPFVTSFVSAAVLADDDSLARRPDWRRTHPRPRATIAEVADHIEHVRKVAGVDHVGIGSDFDGIPRTSWAWRTSRSFRRSSPSWRAEAGATTTWRSWRAAMFCAFSNRPSRCRRD